MSEAKCSKCAYYLQSDILARIKVQHLQQGTDNAVSFHSKNTLAETEN